MASDNETSCVSDPNFAVICSFLEKFAKSCGITHPNILELQEMLENSQEVPQPLIDLHVKLLRKARKSVSGERWEKAIIKFCHSYSNQDGWEIERFGYKKARIGVKLRILKMLLEIQFDLNTKFKTEVNRLSADELRCQPLGRDKMGQTYWCQLDEDCNLRVYREDLDDETWEIVASDREELVQLISQLSSNDPFRKDTEALLNEDSNSLEMEKPVTDTGQTICMPSSATEPFDDEEFHEIEDDDEEEEASSGIGSKQIDGRTLNGGVNSSEVNSSSKYQLESTKETEESSLKHISESNEELCGGLNKDSSETILKNVLQTSEPSENEVSKSVTTSSSEKQSVSETLKGVSDCSPTSSIELSKAKLMEKEFLGTEVIIKETKDVLVKETLATECSAMLEPGTQVPAVQLPDKQLQHVSDVQQSDVQDVSDVQQSDVQHVSDVQQSDVQQSDVQLSDVQLSDVQLSDMQLSDVQLPAMQRPAIQGPDVRAIDVQPSAVQMPTVQPSSVSVPAVQPTAGQMRAVLASTPQTPIPQTPILQVPVPQAPVPQAPVPQALVPLVPVLQTPVPQAQVPLVPVLQTPVPQVPVPQALIAQVPVAQVLSLQTPSKQAPVLQAPAMQIPALQTQDLEAPVLQVPTTQEPAPKMSGEVKSSKEVSVKGETVKAVSANEVSGNEVSANEVSGNEVSSNEVSSNAVSAEEVLAKEVSAKEVSAKEVSAKEVSAKAESAKAESAKAESAKAESAKAESAKAESAKAESAKAESAKAESAKAESAKEVSAKEMTAKEVSAKEITAKEMSAKEMTANEVSAKGMTAKEVSSLEVPTKELSSEEVSKDAQEEITETIASAESKELTFETGVVVKETYVEKQRKESSEDVMKLQKMSETWNVESFGKQSFKPGFSKIETIQVNLTPIKSQKVEQSESEPHETKKEISNIQPLKTDFAVKKQINIMTPDPKNSEIEFHEQKIAEKKSSQILQHSLETPKSKVEICTVSHKKELPEVSCASSSSVISDESTKSLLFQNIPSKIFSSDHILIKEELAHSSLSKGSESLSANKRSESLPKDVSEQISTKSGGHESFPLAKTALPLVSVKCKSSDILKHEISDIISPSIKMSETASAMELLQSAFGDRQPQFGITKAEGSTHKRDLFQFSDKPKVKLPQTVSSSKDEGILSKTIQSENNTDKTKLLKKECQKVVSREVTPKSISLNLMKSKHSEAGKHISLTAIKSDLSDNSSKNEFIGMDLSKTTRTRDLEIAQMHNIGIDLSSKSYGDDQPFHPLEGSGRACSNLVAEDLSDASKRKVPSLENFPTSHFSVLPVTATDLSTKRPITSDLVSNKNSMMGVVSEYPSLQVNCLNMSGKRLHDSDLLVNEAKKLRLEKTLAANCNKLIPTTTATSYRNDHFKSEESEEVGEAIEEPLMLVRGEGSGADCETGNSGKDGDAGKSCTTNKEQMSMEKNADNPDNSKISNDDGDKNVTDKGSKISNSDTDSAMNEKSSEPSIPRAATNFPISTKSSESKSDILKSSAAKSDESLSLSKDAQNIKVNEKKGELKTEQGNNLQEEVKVSHSCSLSRTGETSVASADDHQLSEKGTVKGDGSLNKHPPKLWSIDTICATEHDKAKVGSRQGGSSLLGVVSDSLYSERYNVSSGSSNSPTKRPSRWDVESSHKSGKKNEESVTKTSVFEKQTSSASVGDIKKEKCVTKLKEDPNLLGGIVPDAAVADFGSCDKNVATNKPSEQLQVPEAVAACVGEGVELSHKPDATLEGSIAPKKEEENIPDDAKRKRSNMQVKGFFFGPGCLMKSPIKKTESSRTITEEEEGNEVSCESQLLSDEGNQLIIPSGCSESDENVKFIRQEMTVEVQNNLKSRTPISSSTPSNTSVLSNLEPPSKANVLHSIDTIMLSPNKPPNWTDDTSTFTTLCSTTEKGDVLNSSHDNTDITKSKEGSVFESTSSTLTPKPVNEGTADKVERFSYPSSFVNVDSDKSTYKNKLSSTNVSDSGNSLLTSGENPSIVNVKDTSDSGSMKSINSSGHLSLKEGSMKGKGIPGNISADIRVEKRNENVCKETIDPPVVENEPLKTNEDKKMQRSVSLPQLIDGDTANKKSVSLDTIKVQLSSSPSFVKICESEEIEKETVKKGSTDNESAQVKVVEKPSVSKLLNEERKEEQTDISIVKCEGRKDVSPLITTPDLKNSKNSDVGDSEADKTTNERTIGDKESIICSKDASSGDLGENSTYAGSSCIKSTDPSIPEAAVGNTKDSRKASGSIVTEKNKSVRSEAMDISSKERDIKSSDKSSNKEENSFDVEDIASSNESTVKLVETPIQRKRSDDLTEAFVVSNLTVDAAKSNNTKDILLEAVSDTPSQIAKIDSTPPSQTRTEIVHIFSSKSECKVDNIGMDAKLSSVSSNSEYAIHKDISSHSTDFNQSVDTIAISALGKSNILEDSIATGSGTPISDQESASNSKEDKTKSVTRKEFIVDKCSNLPKLCSNKDESISAAVEEYKLKENLKENIQEVNTPVTTSSSPNAVGETSISRKEFSFKSSEVDKDIDKKHKSELSQVHLEVKTLSLKGKTSLEEKIGDRSSKLDNSLKLVKNSDGMKIISKDRDIVDNDSRKKICTEETKNILEISKDVECEKPEGLSSIPDKMPDNKDTVNESMNELSTSLDYKECSEDTYKKDDKLKSTVGKSHQNITDENKKSDLEVNCDGSSTNSPTVKTTGMISIGNVENPVENIESLNCGKPTVSIHSSTGSEGEKIEISPKSQLSFKDLDPRSKSPTGKTLPSSFSKLKTESQNKARRKSVESISMGIMMGKLAAKSSVQEPSTSTVESSSCGEDISEHSEIVTEVQQLQINAPDTNYLTVSETLKNSPNEEPLQNICESSKSNKGKIDNIVLRTTSNDPNIKEIQTFQNEVVSEDLPESSVDRHLSSSQEMKGDILPTVGNYPVAVIESEKSSDISKDSSAKDRDYKKVPEEGKKCVVNIKERGEGITKNDDTHKKDYENSDTPYHEKINSMDRKEMGSKKEDYGSLKDSTVLTNKDDSKEYKNTDVQESIVIANEKEITVDNDVLRESSKKYTSFTSDIIKPLPIDADQSAKNESLSILPALQSSNDSSVSITSKRSNEEVSADSNDVTTKNITSNLASNMSNVCDQTLSKLEEPDFFEEKVESSFPPNCTQTKNAGIATYQASYIEEKDDTECHKSKENKGVGITDIVNQMTSDSELSKIDLKPVAQEKVAQSEVENSSESNEKSSTVPKEENSIKSNEDMSHIINKEGESVTELDTVRTEEEETFSIKESFTPSVVDKPKSINNRGSEELNKSSAHTNQPSFLKEDSNSVTESFDEPKTDEKPEPSLKTLHDNSKVIEVLGNDTNVTSASATITHEKADHLYNEREGEVTNESHTPPGECSDSASVKVAPSAEKEEKERKNSITTNKTAEIVNVTNLEAIDSKGRGEASSSDGDDRVGDPPVNSECESEIAIERQSRLSVPTRGMRGRRGRGRGGWRGRGRMQRTTTYASPALPQTPAKDEGHSSAGSTPSKRKRGKRAPKLLGLDVGVDIVLEQSKEADEKSEPPVRQSRRIAQMKIREEAERRKLEEMTLQQLKAEQSRRRADVKAEKKETKEGKKRKKKYIESDEDFTAEDVDEEISKKKLKKKKKRRKKKPALSFNESNPWKSSSGSSTSQEEDEEAEQTEEEEEDDEELVFKSDHEFSPESDLENDATEITPTKRARTAQKGQLCAEDEEEPADEHACQKCGKSDHPEWILLCDKCDAGWHGSCLRPALMVIPEGDWFCPPCEHTFLLQNLHNSLLEFDRNWKKRENEELRRKRLAYVGISLDNVLPNKEKEGSEAESDPEGKREPKGMSPSGSESSRSDSGSGSSGDESEPVYQLRERRQTLFSYRFNEYDDLINSAIQDEMEAVKGAGNQGRGKDISTIVKAEAEEKQAAAQKQEEENLEKSDLKEEEEMQIQAEPIPEEMPHVVPKHEIKDDDDDEDDFCPFKKFQTKKKHRRLNSLDISSEDDAESDEDFKGSSSDDEEDEYEEASDAESDDSEFAGRRKKGRRSSGPVRRSSRARITRFDKEFINDDSEDSEPPRKKSRKFWRDSESEDSDASWGRSKKPKKYIPTFKTKEKKKKKKKRSKRSLDSDLETYKTKKPKIKYGGLDDEDDEVSPTRRTRGRKINYQEFAASESEEETWSKTRKLDSEDEYVANEEEEDEEEEEVVPDFDKDSENDSGGEPSDKRKIKSKPERKGKSKRISKNLMEKGSRRGKKPGKPKKKVLIESDDADPHDDIEEPETSAEVNNSHDTVVNTTDLETDALVVPIPTLPSMDIPKEKRGRTRGQGKKVEDQKKKTRRKKRGDIEEDLLDPEIQKDVCQEGFSGPQISDVSLPLQTRRSGDAARKTNEALMKRLSANRTSIHIKSSPDVSDVDQIQGSKLLMEADPLRSLLAAPPVIPPESEVKVNEDISPPVGRRKGRGRGKASATADVAKTQDVGHYPLQNFPPGSAGGNNNSSVITRMLQSQPVSSAPQSFTAAAAAMGHKYFGNSSGEPPMIPMQNAGRGAPSVQPFTGSPKGLQSQYRQPPPIDPNNSALASGMSHFGSSPAGRGSNVRAPPPNFPQTAAMRMRNPSPGNQSHLFHTSHHPMDPSPSGGGPIIISSSGAAPSPPSGSPLTTKPGTPSTSHSTPTPPPPPYSRPGSQMPLAPPVSTSMAPMVPFPMQPGESQPPGRHTPSSFPPASSSHLQSSQGAQQSPPPPPPPPHQGRSPVPGNFSPYHPPPPANYHYGGYPPPPPMSAADDALPPSAFQGSPYTDHYTSEMTANLQASDGSNSKSYEEEGGGEFGGLVSYFSSQREDDLDT